MDWISVSGELADGRHTRVYRSKCGGYGKVVRTPAYGPVDCRSYGKPRTRYFLWADDKDEFETLAEITPNP